MHEFSLAEQLIRTAERLVAAHPGTISEVEVVCGELTAVHPGSLETAFGLLRAGTRLARAQLVLRQAPVVLACATCGGQCEPVDPLLLLCARCGNPQVEVTSGRQIDIVRIRIEDEEQDDQTAGTADGGGERPTRASSGE